MKFSYRINSVFCLFLGLLISFDLYSQNKIQSLSSKNWKKLESKNIILFYPDNYGYLALKTLSIAEKSILYYSLILNHQLSHQVIIFIYPSFRDFQSSNIYPYHLPEGIGGYTEPYFERVVIPFNGKEDEFFHTLKHELVHSFQYDLLLHYYEDRNINLPLWLIEGMAEYLSIQTGGNMNEYLRDLVLSKKLPDLFQLTNNDGYANYKIGQSIMYFIHTQWSISHINLFFRNILLKKDIQKSFILTFNIDIFNFNLKWKEFIYNIYKDTLSNQEFKNRYTFRYYDILNDNMPFHYKPAISPDGKYLSYITYDKIYPAIVIQFVPDYYLKEEELNKRKIILHYLRDENFEEWQPLNTQLNFDSSGQYLFIPTRNKSQLAIIKYHIFEKKIREIYELPFDTIAEPSFHIVHNKELIIFKGTIHGFTDIYVLDVASKQIKKYTNDFKDNFSPVFNFDGDSILYLQKEKNIYNIIELSLETRSKNIILKSTKEIKSIKEGFYKINNQWQKGLYYIKYINKKYLLIFYNYKDKKEYKIIEQSRDILNFDLYIKKISQNEYSLRIVYSTLEEGVYEIFGYDLSKNRTKLLDSYQIKETLNIPQVNSLEEKENLLSENSENLDNKPTIHLMNFFSNYKNYFYRNGYPFIALTGAVDSEGNSSLVFLGYGSISDLQNKHQIDAFLTYQEKPVILNGEIKYGYKLNRLLFYTGVYSYNGIFAILNPLDLSLNHIIYNPYQRLLSNSTYGFYSGSEFYFNQYQAIGSQINIGREEQIYLPRLPEERPNDDVFKNHITLRFYYRYDNAKYTLLGPLDGYAILFGYEIPVKSNSYDKEVYQTIMEFRYYYLFKNFSLFAYRFFIGAQTGKDAKNFPYRIGGYSTIRGYDFQKFEGRYAFLMNIEYRFTFIEQLLFGFPFRWSPGLIRGSIFLDMGAAFDEPKIFQAFEGKKTKDLKASIGIGLHWNNFLWFIFPGAIMKIEWASPYDGKKTLPFNKWQGRFSLGFVF
ncbi:MAG: hypothetical protein KatS3mg129_0608 [Leptospiraceae bacterium]|nr:MAG: hypothetical protein KatS3mg129_0608 [Leptospiraceae bacterium]